MTGDRDIARRMPRSGTHEPEWRIRAKNTAGVLTGKTGLTGVKVRYLTSPDFSAAADSTIAGMSDVDLTARAGAGDLYAGTLDEDAKAPLVTALVTDATPEPVFYEVLIVDDVLRAYQKYQLVDE
jgi:hypothetical protein